MRRNREKGQALILVIVGLSLFLIGALGLAIDGSHLYAQRQMAQTAADAAAQSAIMTLLGSTSGWGTHAAPTGGASWACTTTDTATPCKYAAFNGFGTTASDTVTVSFPAPPVAGTNVASCPSQDPVCLAQVLVTRSVNTTLMRFLGSSATTVNALAMAAIVQEVSPIPIIITHPTLQNSLSLNTSVITICGGPSQSVQINSSNSSAYSLGTVNLTHAGPDDPGDCSGPGGGGSFGVFGGPTSPSGISFGTSGQYLQPHAPIQDPLAFVPYPAVPGTAGSTRVIHGTSAVPVEGCTSTCTEYSPGLWPQINVKNDVAVFRPGLYYIQGTNGFSLKNSTVWMCGTDCAIDAKTGYGMTIYNTGPSGNPTAAGSFNIDTNVNTQRQSVATCPNPDPTNVCTLAGPTDSLNHASNAAPYYGMLFFNNREVAANTHSLGQGNGCWSLTGTLYITNTLSIMLADPTQYQAVSYNGNPCSITFNQGEMIVSALSMVGAHDAIDMKLAPTATLEINQVALVH